MVSPATLMPRWALSVTVNDAYFYCIFSWFLLGQRDVIDFCQANLSEAALLTRHLSVSPGAFLCEWAYLPHADTLSISSSCGEPRLHEIPKGPLHTT